LKSARLAARIAKSSPRCFNNACVVQCVLVDQWLVDTGKCLLTPADPPDIRLVAENPQHDGGLPATGRRGRMFTVEPAGDRRRRAVRRRTT